jgi:hypothetical protein
MAVLGTNLSAHSGTYRVINTSTDNVRGMVLDAFVAPSNGYITRIGGFIRKQASVLSRYVWLEVYALDAAGTPTMLLGHTSRIPLSQTGQDVSGDLVWSDPHLNGEDTAVRLVAGQPFAVVLKAEASGSAGNIEVAQLPDSTARHFFRTYATPNAPAPDPLGGVTSETAATLALYVEFTENTKPFITVTDPDTGAALNTSTPTFMAEFDDPQDNFPTFDKMSRYELRIAKKVGDVTVWGGAGAVFIASETERMMAEFARLYSGPPLLADGTIYTWSARVYDDSGAASNWSTPLEFTINPYGQVNTAFDGAPTGKIDTDPALIDYTARWHHPAGLSADKAQVLIYHLGSLYRIGAEVDLSPNVVTAAPPGNLVTVQDTVAGIGKLPPGTYEYRIKIQDTTGQWSPESQPGRLFIVNSPPTIPSALQPPSGASTTSLPLLEWNVDDEDDDDVYGVDADSQLLITRPGGSQVTITTSNYDAVRGVGFWQGTVAVFNTFGTFRWKVLGRDISAGVLGESPYSTENTIEFVAGPVVTITNPIEDEVQNTAVPLITWTNTGGTQSRARVVLYNRDSGLPLKAADVAGVTQQFQIPVGWLTNGGAYEITVQVWVSELSSGTSLRREFTVSYSTPATLNNVQASGALERRDYYLTPSSILLSWQETVYPPGEFAGYVVRRREATQSPADAIVLRVLEARGQTQWKDYWAPSGVLLIYGISQLRRVGSETLESPIVEVEEQINLVVPVLCSAKDALTYRMPLMYIEDDWDFAGADPYRDNDVKVYTWASKGKPTIIDVPDEQTGEPREVSFSMTIKSDARGHLYDHYKDWEDMARSKHPLLLRTEWEHERMYCKIKQWSASRGGVGERVISATLEEIDFVPGESGGS